MYYKETLGAPVKNVTVKEYDTTPKECTTKCILPTLLIFPPSVVGWTVGIEYTR
jgi:hypothetical protein